MAETELLRWQNYAVRDVLRSGLGRHVGAGPSGEHYDSGHVEVGCGTSSWREQRARIPLIVW